MATNNEKLQELSVEEKLQHLYELQRIDTEIDKIKTLRGELPLEVQDLEDEIAGLETRLENLKNEISEADKSVTNKNQEITKSEELIKKYSEQLDNVRNNREYDALTKEVEFQKLEIELQQKRIREAQKLKAEKEVNLETDSFYCSGYLQVQDAKIGCSKTSGHGAQTFTQALTNSCNPAFMEIGLRLGIDKFSYYLQGFGLKEKTGVDLPGEVAGVCVKKDTMSLVDLASSAFGQANELTALELITAYSAAINGGELITPYVVDHVTDTNGNVLLQNGKKVKRQVISEGTSKTVREQLQAVVDNNPTHNAYIQGYKIGGKSGTAEIRATRDIEDDYVSSYCCFAPADDPELIMLIQADYPDPSIGYYGSQVVTPYARDIMEEILPYMGFYPEYSSEDYDTMNVSVPLLTNSDTESAKSTLDQMGLT